jgi:NAD(P)-dependent dehydrogenase (short-subunit alcohol dehydrogenase family)
MRTEARLFTGVAVFFAVTAAGYGWFSEEPAGTAVLAIAKFALPHMPEGGSIINSTSVQAYKPSPHLLDYATTKGVIVTFTQGLAQMLVDRGIRVNAGRAGSGMDAADPRDAAGHGEVRQAGPLGAPGTARRAGPGVRLSRLPGGELHHGGDPQRYGRHALATGGPAVVALARRTRRRELSA